MQRPLFKDWSPILGRGGGGGWRVGWLKNWRGGGHVKFYPMKRGGGGGVLAMIQLGHKQFGVDFTP